MCGERFNGGARSGRIGIGRARKRTAQRSEQDRAVVPSHSESERETGSAKRARDRTVVPSFGEERAAQLNERDRGERLNRVSEIGP